MRRILCQSIKLQLFAGVIVACCVTSALCKDFNNTYKNCVKNEQGQEPKAVQDYIRCFTAAPDFKSNPSCDSNDDSKCVVALADDLTFQKCIGSTNLETLETVSRIFHTQYEYRCSDEGRNDTSKFVENDGPTCSMKHREETLRCYEDAKYPIAARTLDVGTLAGFVFNEDYCKTLKEFDNCEMEAIAECKPEVKYYTQKSHELRWNATPCKDLVNSGSRPSPSLLTSLIATCLLGRKLYNIFIS